MTIFKYMRNLVCLAAFIAIIPMKNAHAENGNIHVTAELSNPYLNLTSDHPQTVYLKIGLKGDPLINGEKRPPMNIALVLDKSGSMEGDKIENLRAAAKMLVDRLGREDTLSVVTYDTVIDVLVPATPLENPDLVKSRIDTIRAGGGTALFAGVSKGADELRKFISDNKVNRIILLSDGLANVGPSSPAELGDLGGSLIREGISVSTIGLGLDFNEDLMTQLAGRSDGFHQFAERPESLTQFFDWEFGNAASTVANNVDIDVQFSSGVRPLRVLGRESQAEIYANKVSARLNQIFSSHEIYLLVEAEVSPDFNGSSVASTTVTFHDLSRKQHGQQVVDTPVTLTRDKGLADRTRDRDVMVAAAEQKAALSQQEAIRLRDEGKVSEAKSKLEEMSDTLRDAGSLFQSQKLYEYADTLRKEWQNMSNDAEWNKNRKDTAERLNKGRFNVQ